MKIFTWLSCIFVAVTSVSAQDTKVPPTELQIESTFKPDACPHQAQKGDRLWVHYTGTLFANGKKFDSSFDRGQPFPLTLGAGQVIKGWDQGLLGVCLQEKRTLTIPSHLAYGSKGFGSVIPANSALVFTIVVVELEPGHEEL